MKGYLRDSEMNNNKLGKSFMYSYVTLKLTYDACWKGYHKLQRNP